jgi:hypothetical protein
MSAKLKVTALLALAVGFAAGYLVRGDAPAADPVAKQTTEAAARKALDELVRFRGQGATAVRKAMRLVREIGAGGEAILPAVAEALRTTPDHRYGFTGYSLDARAGELSVHPGRRSALIEAAHLAGGPGSTKVLIAAAGQGGPWINRITALLYLAQRADEEEVQSFFFDLVKKVVVARRSGPESIQILDIVCGRLPAEAFPVLEAGMADGPARTDITELLARAMVAIDRRKAGSALVRILSDPTKAPGSRAMAARALATLAEQRPVAMEHVLNSMEPAVLEAFAQGLRLGRIDEIQRSRAASASTDPAERLAYSRERLADMEEAYALLGELKLKLGEEVAKHAKLPTYLEMFATSIKEAKQLIARMEAGETTTDETGD